MRAQELGRISFFGTLVFTWLPYLTGGMPMSRLLWSYVLGHPEAGAVIDALKFNFIHERSYETKT